MAAAAALLLMLTDGTALASPAGSVCDQPLDKSIPVRAAGALTGTSFAERVRDLATFIGFTLIEEDV